MFEAVGHRVKRLHRSRYGPLTLEGLEPGAWRELEASEVQLLRSVTTQGSRPRGRARGRAGSEPGVIQVFAWFSIEPGRPARGVVQRPPDVAGERVPLRGQVRDRRLDLVVLQRIVVFSAAVDATSVSVAN